jgi:hypothetical protein
MAGRFGDLGAPSPSMCFAGRGGRQLKLAAGTKAAPSTESAPPAIGGPG